MIKRLFDITAATTAIIVLSPIYGIVAYKVKKNLGSPVLFRQTRPGQHGIPFEMIKFRSMKDAIDIEGNLLPDEERLTAFGRTLRNTSLDELLELWNVIKGDTSLVGPRPLLMEYLTLYNDEQKRRHLLRPGITGFAQEKNIYEAVLMVLSVISKSCFVYRSKPKRNFNIFLYDSSYSLCS